MEYTSGGVSDPWSILHMESFVSSVFHCAGVLRGANSQAPPRPGPPPAPPDTLYPALPLSGKQNVALLHCSVSLSPATVNVLLSTESLLLQREIDRASFSTIFFQADSSSAQIHRSVLLYRS